MNEEKDVVEIDLWKLIRFYCKKWWILLISSGTTALCGLLISLFLITPMYSSSITIYVNSVNSNYELEYITGSTLMASQQLVNTYINILQGTSVLEEVSREAGLNCTPTQLRNMISAKQVDETELLQVTVQHQEPEIAAAIANTIGEVAPEFISKMVEGSSAKVIDRDGLPEHPSSPNVMKNTVLGGLLGILLAGIALTLRYLFDFRLQDEEDMAQYFDAPVLGSIPSYKHSGNQAQGRAAGHFSQGRNA